MANKLEKELLEYFSNLILNNNESSGNITITKTLYQKLKSLGKYEVIKKYLNINEEALRQTHYHYNIINKNNLKKYIKEFNKHLFINEENAEYIIEKLKNFYEGNDYQVPKKFINEFNHFEDKEKIKKFFKIEETLIEETKTTILFNEKNIKYINDSILKGEFLLEQEFNKNKDFFSPKSELAIYNKTHEAKSSFSLISMIQNDKIYNIVLPLNLNHIYNTLNNFNKKALIIENLENFLHYKEFINEFEEELDIKELDIIFSSGNAILSEKNHEFLNQYDEIFLFLDLDKAGMDIYLNFKKNFGNKCKNIYVKDIEKYFLKIQSQNHSFKEKIFEYIKTNIESLTKKDIEILVLIDKYGTIEQEIFLN